MKSNLTGQICEFCGSHIYVYEESNKLFFECSYCGKAPENISFLPKFKEELENEQKENL